MITGADQSIAGGFARMERGNFNTFPLWAKDHGAYSVGGCKVLSRLPRYLWHDGTAPYALIRWLRSTSSRLHMTCVRMFWFQL